MFQSPKFWILVLSAFGSLSSALEHEILQTEYSAGAVYQDFAYTFELAHEHSDEILHKLNFHPKEILPEFNYHVSIERGRDPICSGALLFGGNYVITAASCGIKNTDIVHFNLTQLNDDYYNKKVVGITCVKNHPKFHNNATHEYDYDIALLRLNKTLTSHTALYPNTPGYVPYAGRITYYSTFSQYPQEGSLVFAYAPIYNSTECGKRFGFHLTENMLCAGSYSEDASFCQEDSGSPLVVGQRLIGIKSWGQHCSRIVLPAVFTNISVVGKWIHDTIRLPNC